MNFQAPQHQAQVDQEQNDVGSQATTTFDNSESNAIPVLQVASTARATADSSAGRANWTPAQKSYLLQRLVEFKEQGKASDTGFKKEVWVSLVVDFNRYFRTSYNELQLKTQFGTAKKEYKQFKSLSVSGFGWNEDGQQLEADPEVWDEMIEKLGDYVKRFRDHPFPNRDLMYRLFDAVIATGQYALSSTVGANAVAPDASVPAVPLVSSPAAISTPQSSRSRNTTLSSQSSQIGLHLLPSPANTSEDVQPGRSTSPRKKSRKEGGLSQLSASIEASRVTMENIKSELTVALNKFVKWSEQRIVSIRTKVLCKQIISTGKNATVFLSLDEIEYKDWFELMFEQTGQQTTFTAELLEENHTAPAAVSTGHNVALFTSIPSIAQLEASSDEDNGISDGADSENALESIACNR